MQETQLVLEQDKAAMQEAVEKILGKPKVKRPAKVYSNRATFGGDGTNGSPTVSNMMAPYTPAKRGPRKSETYRAARRLAAKIARKS